MILQKLADYYDRKASDPDAGLAPEGFEIKEIPFLVVVDAQGEFVQLRDTRSGDGRKKRGRAFVVPQGMKRAANVAANLLWDTAEYALGITNRENTRLKAQHADFLRRLDEDLPEMPEILAIRRFLASQPALRFEGVPEWQEIFETNPTVSFAIADVKGIPQPVFSLPAVRKALSEAQTEAGMKEAVCLVRGEVDEIARLHPAIKGVWGAQTSGANIVSFNQQAFTSHGKWGHQGDNAPVGQKAVFAYTTALNHLLGRDSAQRLQVGDASTVFWADKPCDFEDDFAFAFSDAKDDPDRRTRFIRRLYESAERGGFPDLDDTTHLFVLGLSPNAARISVRFWLQGTVREFARQIGQHFKDLQIVHAPFEPDYLPLFPLLLSVAALRKSENIPPNLGGEVIRSILSGLPYPATFFQGAIRRTRAEQEVTYERAAVIKAFINRSTRFKNPNNPEKKEELKVSLDTNNTNPGYLLGRLFAVLERIQDAASPGINATIRDRFYGAASSTPVTVFPNLLKLSNHHLAKLAGTNKGQQVFLERLVGEIMNGMDGERAGFPGVMPLEDQGRFAIGYYQQRQAFFTPKEKDDSIENMNAGEK